MSRWCRADTVAIQAQAYHRGPLEPLPAERASQRRSLSLRSFFTASAQVIVVPGASVSMKDDATRST